MIKRYLLLLCTLAVQVSGLASCGDVSDGDSVSAVGTVSDQPTVSVSVSHQETGDVRGEYLSTEGDGEILCLYADGTFLAYTVTDLSAESESGSVPFTMTEQVRGVYTRRDGEVQLAIGEIAFSVTGLEEYPQLVEQQADALAGADAELHALYVKLFGGERVDGQELLGEERFAKLLAAKIFVTTDEQNATFTYKREENQ